MILDEAKLISVHNTLEGLRQGLSHFSGPSRVALLMAETPESPLCVCDPGRLLRGCESELAAFYLESGRWRDGAPPTAGMKAFGEYRLAETPPVEGLIRAGGYARSLFYQMWFTDAHQDMCCVGPTERWLEHAVWLLAHDFASEGAFFTSASKHALQAFQRHAVKNHLFNELFRLMGRAPRVPLHPLLDAVLAVSSTLEEGRKPVGRLVFVEPEDEADVPWLVRFRGRDLPRLANAKHVRKLLQSVEDSLRRLVSDGTHVLGVSAPYVPENRLSADFRDSHGFLLLGGRPVCSFGPNGFSSTSRKADLGLLQTALCGLCPDQNQARALSTVVSAVVDQARAEGFGCVLVVDPTRSCSDLAGQLVDPELDLNVPAHLDLAKALARMDGALHIADLGLLTSFACLLDGRAVPGEDRARGARFNSALRFSSEHPELAVVVVSEDRPVSVFRGGKVLRDAAALAWSAEVDMFPPSLQAWLEGA